MSEKSETKEGKPDLTLVRKLVSHAANTRSPVARKLLRQHGVNVGRRFVKVVSKKDAVKE